MEHMNSGKTKSLTSLSWKSTVNSMESPPLVPASQSPASPTSPIIHSQTFPLLRQNTPDKQKDRPLTHPAHGRPASQFSLSLPLTTTDWVLRWSIDQNSGRHSELRKPTQVDFLKNGDVVVFEAKRYRVQVLDRRGAQRVCIDRRTDKHMQHPKSVCTAMDGQMLVVADNQNAILYDSNGKFLRCRPMTHNKILNVASRGPNLITAETGQQRSVVERTLDGTAIRKFHADYKYPGHIAVQSETHNVCVSDSESHCVFLFDARQKGPVRKIGTHKYCERKLIWPTGVAFSSCDSVLVADKAQDFVAEYDLRGYYKCDVLSYEKDGLRCPVALAMSRKGRIVVTEELLDYKRDHYSLKMFVPLLQLRGAVSV